MITRVDEIPITKDSYPFCSAMKYCGLSKGLLLKEDLEDLVDFAVGLAREGGLED